MRKTGIVKEIFLPTQIKNGINVIPEEIEYLGFKIEVDGKINTIVEKQTTENITILREDRVYIEENKIEKISEENDE